MRNAALSKNEKSLVSARIQGTSAFTAEARQMRRLFGSCGSAASQDVLFAADVDLSSENESNHAAWLARRKATKSRNFASRGRSDGKTGGNKVMVGP